jgi:hypothetical protein
MSIPVDPSGKYLYVPNTNFTIINLKVSSDFRMGGQGNIFCDRTARQCRFEAPKVVPGLSFR